MNGTVVVRRLMACSPPADVAAAARLLGRCRAFVGGAAGPGFPMPRLDAAIAFAAAGGRSALLLDSEPGPMAAAVRLYRRMGFVPAAASADAAAGLAFFRLDLGGAGS